MTRVVGRTILVLVAMSLVAVSTVNAAPARLGDPAEALYAIPGSGSAIGPRTFTGTGFEQSEGYANGTISNVNAWRCFGAATAYPPAGAGPRCPGTLTNNTTLPFVDPSATGGELAGVIKKGNGSQHGYYLTQNFNFAAPTNVGAFTPKFKDFLQPTLNVDLKIEDNGGADYSLVPQTPAQGFSTSRVIFAYNGYIYALDDPGGTLQFVNIGTWTGGVWNTFQFDYDYAGLSVKFSMGPDKEHLTLLYTGHLYGGTQTEELVIFSNNFQSTGLGTFEEAGVNHDHGPGTDIDNIVFKPEPGTLAMLGAGLLLAIRRRR